MEPIALRITSVSRDGTGCRFSFTVQEGECYRVEYTTDLGNSAWQLLTLITGSGPMADVIDATASDRHRFYRVKVGQD